MTAQSPMYVLLVFALFLVAGASWYFKTRRGAVRGEVAASPEPVSTTEGRLADVIARLHDLDLRLKAHVRDYEDFEETVRRWQGRVNKQQSRDTADTKGSDRADDDPSQISLLPPSAGAAASAADSRRGQRFTRSQLMAGRR